jgi:hypothetical protein
MFDVPEQSDFKPSLCAGNDESSEACCSDVRSENFEESEEEYDRNRV